MPALLEENRRSGRGWKRGAVMLAACLAAGAAIGLGCAFFMAQNRYEPPMLQGVKEQVVVYADDNIQAALLEGVTAVGGEDRQGQTFPVRVDIYNDAAEKVGECQPGTYRLVYRSDGGGEAVPVESVLIVHPADTQPPVITGARDLTVKVGGSISYRDGVTASDNVDGKVQLQVDAGQVNLTQPGTYPVIYSAKDARGNESTVAITVTVEEAGGADDPGEDGQDTPQGSGVSAENVTREDLDALADRILGQIITPGMSQYQKAKAIFDYVHSHIKYVGTSDKSSWIKGAYVGLTQGRGDCFNYFACSKELLTRAGISNIDLYRVGGTTDHYWQLVNVGDGWYHFDACPHPNSYPIVSFMLTEAEVRDYTQRCSSVRKNYYVYDYDACGVTVVGTPEEETPSEPEKPAEQAPAQPMEEPPTAAPNPPEEELPAEPPVEESAVEPPRQPEEIPSQDIRAVEQ